MGKISVIGLGPGDIDLLTVKAFKMINESEKIYLRTNKHKIVNYLNENNIEYESYDYVYEEKESFEDVYEFITDDLVNKSKDKDIIYCVPNNPFEGDETVNNLIKYRNQNIVDVEIIPGVSSIDTCVNTVEIDIFEGIKVIDGLNINNFDIDININTLLTQVYDNIIASEVKIILEDYYDSEKEIYIINTENYSYNKIKLYELDRIDNLSHTTYIYIPRERDIERNRYNMYNLYKIMKRLRDKDGCPWDLKQTHDSLRQYIIEEAYEVVDAIDNEDFDSLVEELGDLLLQIVFHSVIADEEGYFNFNDVTTSICNKMITRHPHVFGDLSLNNEEEVLTNWTEIKDKEKNINSYTERITSIPRNFPALKRSYKIQKKAAEVGFDWPDINGAIRKFEEEFNELIEEIKDNNLLKMEEELGDLIFAIVNIARFIDIDPEIALNKTSNKFINRFKFIEEESVKQGKNLKNMTLEEMDLLWNMAKIHKK